MHGRDEAQHALVDAIVDGAPVLIVVVDAVGTILFCNDACERMVGWTADELVGQNMLSFADLEWNPVAAESIGTALEAEGLRLPMRFRIRHKDGSYLVVEVTANTRFHDPDVEGMIVYIRDWEQQDALDEILKSIAGDETLETKLDLFVQLMAAQPLGADGVVLYEPGPDGFGQRVARPSVDARLLADATDAPWSRVLATGQEQEVEVAALPAPYRTAAIDQGYRWCWAFPVRDAADTVRACLVLWRRDDRPMEESFRDAVNRVSRFTKVVLEQEDNRARLLHAAGHDPLTGLYNRASFFQHFQDLLDDPSREGYVGVLYVDLDGFKPVNDTLGHGAGDAVLIAIAERFANRVRSEDVLARMGGDEFAVVCPSLRSPAELEALATRLTRAAREPVHIGDHLVEVSASVGASLAAAGTCSINALVDAADSAMYRAKASDAGSWHLVTVD